MAKLGDLWIERAACGGNDPKLWFDYEPQSINHKTAIKICIGCEVRRQCYVSAIERRERYGIWGGIDFTTLKQRYRNAPVNF